MADQRKNGAQKFVWGVEEYGTRDEVEHAIAQFCVDHLADGDVGAVEHGGESYNIEITARLVGTVEGAPAPEPAGPGGPVESVAKRMVDRLIG